MKQFHRATKVERRLDINLSKKTLDREALIGGNGLLGESENTLVSNEKVRFAFDQKTRWYLGYSSCMDGPSIPSFGHHVIVNQ